MLTRNLATTFVSASLFCLSPFSVLTSSASPGDLDVTFGTGGVSLVPVGPSNDVGRAVAVQTDGRVVVAGHTSSLSSQSRFALARYNPDGTLDATFGAGGRVATSIEGDDQAFALAIQSDGRIVATGYARTPGGGQWKFATARYHRDGSLDTTFGGTGKVTTTINVTGDRARAIAIQPDGKIVVAGHTWQGNGDFALVRYNGDGSLDTTFNGTGVATTSVGLTDNANAVAIQADGRIVVAGSTSNVIQGTNPDFALVRFESNGSLDATFGSAGKVVTAFDATADEVHAVAIQPDGRIVAAGAAHAGVDLAFARYTANGSLDATFGGSGKVTFSIGFGQEAVRALVVQPDGRILAAGQAWGYPYAHFVLARLNADGTPDSGFGTAGKAMLAANGTFEGAGLALRGDGTFVIAGSAQGHGLYDFAVARFLSNGTPDPSFGGAAPVLTEFGRGADGQWDAVAVQPDGRIVAAGRVTVGASSEVAVARFDEGGNLDATFGVDGRITFAHGAPDGRANAVAFQPDGKTVVAGSSGTGANANFALARLTPGGALDTSFGNAGKVTTAVTTGEDSAHAMALLIDGRIVVAGRSHNGADFDFALARYNADGSLDTTFNAGGEVITAIGSGNDSARALAIQPDGKIVVAGYSHNGVKNDFALARYSASGVIDATFGSGGKVTTTIGTFADEATAIAIQADGKIIAAGVSVTPPSSFFTIVRYNADGSLDTTFNTTGKVTIAISPGTDGATSMALQADGKIVAGGYAMAAFGTDLGLVRLNANGTPDSSFGTSGRVSTPVGDESDRVNALVLQRDGKVVVAGKATGLDPPFLLARYLLEQSPGAISFVAQSGVAPGVTVTSNAAVISGITGSVPISVIDGAYSISCDPGGFTTVPGIIPGGANVCVRHRASDYPFDTITTTLIVGTTVASFSSTTGRAAAQLALVSGANPSVAGASVTFTATVSGIFGPPTGVVTFGADGSVFGAASLDGAGQAQAATAMLVSGARSITAEYAGDLFYLPATSTPLSQTVNAVVSVPRPRGDFSGDRKADLVWRDASGNLALWTMDGTAITATFFGTVGTEWQIADVADVDGDGRADLFWWNATLGAGYLWFLDGAAFTGFADLGVLGAEWAPVGSADFDGDGTSDILFRRSTDGLLWVWLMNGGTIVSQGSPGAVTAPWQVIDLADFDGDGKADIVFRNTADGGITIWTMNGIAFASNNYLGAVDAGFWQIVAAADFDGDGKADLLWRGANGDAWVWLMNGTSITSAASLGNLGPGWSVRAASDFTGDGRADIVWRFVDGTVYLWIMNGTQIVSTPQIANPGGTWQIVAP